MNLKKLKCKLFNRHDDVRVIGVHLVTYAPEVGRCNICDEVVKCKKITPQWRRMNITGGWDQL